LPFSLMTIGGDKRRITEYFKKVGAHGATCDEIEVELGLSHQTASARFKELDRKGTIVIKMQKTGIATRRKTRRGSKARVFVLAQYAEPQSEPEPVKFRTGIAAKPEERVPTTLLRDIINAEMLLSGYAVSSDINGEPCQLPIDVSKLERDECVAMSIGGSSVFKDRKAYYKWQTYHTKRIRDKVLKVLESMNPIEIPKAFKVDAVSYKYDLGISSDLQELADMLHADLSRCAKALEIREKYGHLYPVKSAASPTLVTPASGCAIS
jgi:hypothetical protein